MRVGSARKRLSRNRLLVTLKPANIYWYKINHEAITESDEDSWKLKETFFGVAKYHLSFQEIWSKKVQQCHSKRFNDVRISLCYI